MHTQSLTGHWQFRQIAETEREQPTRWQPARVPGGVHTDLLALGEIPDPFVSDNEVRVQWVAERDWEYRRVFEVDPALLEEAHVFLVANGLDTLAEVLVNEQRVAETDNAFRQYRWEVKDLLREGENTLTVRFRSPVAYITSLQDARSLRGVSQAIPGAPYVRKAPCQFGWDWGPQLPPIGIWKDIRLEAGSVARLADVHARQVHRQDGGVEVTVAVGVERWQDVPLAVVLRVTDPDSDVEEVRATVTGDAVTAHVLIEDPRLWWPNGYGEQPLYKVDVELVADSAVCDGWAAQMGLRTLELCREDDAWGESFIFVVNGVPVFAKGSNWIPADSFPTRLSDAHLESLIRDAAATHQNMLRVWGGGFYEEERFYDLCDKYGILVWQDFTFACSIYPMLDEAFVENAHQEVIQAIRRLRHHASLALWCGNNEMEWGWDEWGWDTPAHADLKVGYDQFFHHLLPAWVAAEDPDRAYWPSSPSSRTPFTQVNSNARGDAHYWGVWHGGQPFSAYLDQYPRFMSEFGFQSLPPLETIRTYADETDWNLTSYIMEHHQRNATGNGKMIGQMSSHFRMPKDFPALVYLTQVLQAEAIRIGVEHWRRNRHRVGGTLYWQLNDCWPVASWASLDYFGRWKALHYVARRFYAPVLLSLEEDGARVTVHVTSDVTESWEGTVRWSLQTLAGEKLVSGAEATLVAPLSSTAVCALDFTAQIDDVDHVRDVVLVCELWQGEVFVSRALATFVPNKHLGLVDPGLKTEMHARDNQLHITVQAATLARFIEVALEGADFVFSDNYFDVPAGEVVTVTCPLPEGWSLEQAKVALRVSSLYNSFA